VHPIWTLFSRRTLSRLAYWLSALGYNLKDSSVVNRVYLLYFFGFWGAWGVAMLALVGGGLARALVAVQPSVSPETLLVSVPGYLLMAWSVITLWRVTGRSPFVFSEEDAYLLCQTPVSRRRVALAWFVQGLMGFALLVGAATVILAFAIVAWRFPTQPGLSLLSLSLRVSFIGLILAVPMQVGLQAVLWSVGAYRLTWRHTPSWLRPAAAAGVLVLGLALLIPAAAPLARAPFTLPFQAAFAPSTAQGLPVLAITLSWLGLVGGLALLLAASGRMSLGKAAVETTHVATIGMARSYGQFELVDTILMRRRLGATHDASRLLRGRGRLILQLVVAGVWTVVMGGFMTSRLRNDLAHWWLWRGLPLRAANLFSEELAFPWGTAVLLGWIALLVSDMPGPAVLAGAVMVPLLAASVAMASSADILRRARSRVLMSPSLADENVPRPGVGGVILALVSVLIPYATLVWAASVPGGAVLGLVAVPTALAVAWLNGRSLLAAYQRME